MYLKQYKCHTFKHLENTGIFLFYSDIKSKLLQLENLKSFKKTFGKGNNSYSKHKLLIQAKYR